MSFACSLIASRNQPHTGFRQWYQFALGQGSICHSPCKLVMFHQTCLHVEAYFTMSTSALPLSTVWSFASISLTEMCSSWSLWKNVSQDIQNHKAYAVFMHIYGFVNIFLYHKSFLLAAIRLHICTPYNASSLLYIFSQQSKKVSFTCQY